MHKCAHAGGLLEHASFKKTVVSQTLYPMAFRGNELQQWPM